MERPTFIHLYFSTPFKHENRALRAAECAIASGLAGSVLFVGYKVSDGLLEHEELLPGARVWRVPLRKLDWLPRGIRRAFHFAEWNLRVLGGIAKNDAPLLQCHNLATLPLCVLLKLYRRRTLLYDAHELETERNGWSPFLKIASKALEFALMPFANHTLVVSDSIREWYKKTYRGTAVSTIRNVPHRVRERPETTDGLRKELGIPPGHLIFLYQGGLGPGRGTELLLQTFCSLPPDKHLVFMGFGAEELVRSRAGGVPNIHYKSAVPPEQIYEYASSADVGLALIEDTCLSYRYCLPNKLFEYLHAGIPVIVSDLPEMANIIQTYRGGWIVQPKTDALRSLIQGLTPESIAKVTAGIDPRIADVCWETEAPHLQEIYRQLLEDHTATENTRSIKASSKYL